MAKVNCPLCGHEFEKEKLKTNTHFLTDGIIRQALNFDGSNVKDKGFYNEFSSNSPYIGFNFQRKASEKFSEAFERQANSVEIEKSKNTIAFSVDYIFCKDCEDKFTKIETKFQADILKKMREKGEKNLITESILHFENSNLIRVFFLLQIWRTNICEPIFKLSNEVSNELRNIILEYGEGQIEISKKHPLIINYLETLGGGIEYTKNTVGYSNDKNPFPIWMNDFVIQFYESKEDLIYKDFYELNGKETFQNEANVDEKIFKINIKSNLFRSNFNEKLLKENVITKISQYTSNFKYIWNKIFKNYPSQNIINKYLIPFIYSNSNIYYKYSEENLKNYTLKFIEYFISNDQSYAKIYHKFLSKKFDAFNRSK